MRTKLHLLLFSLALGFTFQSAAQVTVPNRGCGSGILSQQFESWVQSLQQNAPNRNGQNQTMSVFNIPVIVHVIHNNHPVNSASATSGDNLNAAQIIDQINILNKDYNGLNPDTTLIPAVFKPLLGKFQFNFCLAVVNPTGGVMPEPGIERVNSAASSFSATAAPYTMSFITSTIKPATIWDPNRYMNMWVVNMGGGILGYATFPNPGTSGLPGLTGTFGTPTTDGLVMLNTAFGSIGTAVSGAPYNLGRTATHEIGHWLGLRHTWGDGTCATDYCNDTPPAQNSNFGCQTFPYKLGVCTGNTTGEMTMNYMDYSDDVCLYMFTNDQKNRAQLIMTNSSMRATLLTSTVCNLPSVTDELAVLFVNSPTYSQVVTCNNFINPVITLHNSGSNTITSATFTFNVDGVNTQTMSWGGSISPGASQALAMPTINNISNGAHAYHVGAYLPNGVPDPNMTNNSNSQFFNISGSFTLAINGATTVCAGGSASLIASGANTYTWNPGTIISNSIIVNPTSATVYSVDGSNGVCVNSQTILINVGASLSVTANPSVICGSGSATLSALGASSFTWDSGGNGSVLVVTPSTTTTYTVLGDNGTSACTGSAAITITVTAAPTLTVNSNPVTSICAGGSATLTVSGADTYSWDSGATSSLVVVSPASTTVYTISGNNSGCISTQTVSVAVGSGSIALLISASPSSVCAGGSSTLTASGATSYSWNTSAVSSSIVVSPTVTTVYSFDGSDGTCLGTASITLNVVPSDSLFVTLSPASGTVCLGNTATLSATGTYSSYVWSNPVVNNASVIVTPTTTTSYTVAGVGGAPGCSTSSVITLYVAGSPTSSLSTVNSSCSNPCTGVANVTTTGGTAPYSYLIGSTAYTAMPATNLCPGLYVMHTNDANGCSSSNIFSIANFASGFLASVSYTNASCDTCLDGVVHANVSSGVGPFTYSWSPMGGSSATIDNLHYGCYTVTVRDSVGCMVNASGCVYLVNGIKTVSSNSNLFSLYPNPAKESVTIALDGSNFDYTVYNHLGQLILSQKNNWSTATFSLGDFASGIYLIEVNDGKEKARKKLIVE